MTKSIRQRDATFFETLLQKQITGNEIIIMQGEDKVHAHMIVMKLILC